MAGYSGGGGAGGGSGAPTDAQYLTLAVDGGLSAERVLTAGSNITLTDGGAGGALTIASTAPSGAPPAAQYVTLAADGGLTNERVLAAGTGISLTDGGAGGNITIAATGGGGGGKILQVVHANFDGVFATNATTYGDVTDGSKTLEAAITPTAATSTILISINLNCSINNAGYTGLFRVWDGSAAVGGGVGTEPTHDDNVVVNLWSGSDTWAQYVITGKPIIVLDSPASTSAITYTVQCKSVHATQTAAVNKNIRNGNYLADSPVASTITLFEIGV